MRLAERPPQPLRRLRGQDQMDVVRHQAIGPYRDPFAPAGLMQKIAIERVIVVAEEHFFAPIAALGHVMRQIGNDKPADARNGGS